MKNPFPVPAWHRYGGILVGFSLLSLGACAAPASSGDSSSEKTAMAQASVSGTCPQPRKTPMAPPAVYNLSNPLPPTAENMEAGKKLFQRKAKPLACKLCHGEAGDGKGDPDFESTPPARNFTCGPTMKPLSDGQLFWIIRNGSPQTSMPAYADLSADDIWKLAHYIRGFSRTE